VSCWLAAVVVEVTVRSVAAGDKAPSCVCDDSPLATAVLRVCAAEKQRERQWRQVAAKQHRQVHNTDNDDGGGGDDDDDDSKHDQDDDDAEDEYHTSSGGGGGGGGPSPSAGAEALGVTRRAAVAALTRADDRALARLGGAWLRRV
jgi:hypothetical protein